MELLKLYENGSLKELNCTELFETNGGTINGNSVGYWVGYYFTIGLDMLVNPKYRED